MSITLEWPVDTPTRTVILRSPGHGEEEEVKTHQIVRRTRGGDTKGFRDPNWLKIHTFKYDIAALTRTLKDELIEFLVATTGQRIKWTDHIGAVREGYVVTPEVEFITIWDKIPAGIDSDCEYGAFDVTFEVMQDPDNSAYYLMIDEDDFAIVSQDSEQLEMEHDET